MIRVSPRCRVILDNDWAGDPDGLVALAHHVLSPANELIAVTGSLTSPMFGDPAGQAAFGAALADELLALLQRNPLRASAGSDAPFDRTERESAAAEAIVRAAREPSDLPTILVCAGPLTNVADALLADPGIASRVILAWVGGTADLPTRGSDEYNYITDPAAAHFVLDHPDLVVWQFPAETYRRVVVSIAELERMFDAGGPAGSWLRRRFTELRVPDFVEFGPLWCLGDSAPLVVTGLDDISSSYVLTRSDPERRRYTDVDTRLLVADLQARLERFEEME